MRGIVEQPRVTEAVGEAELVWSRTDDAWQAVLWVLARDADIGTPVDPSGTLRGFVFEGAQSLGMPTVEVIYRVEPHQIIIEDALFRTARFPRSGRA